ncbi:MAG: arsenite S-adenosylmethyltransferase, partial [Cytophagales bacterium]
AIQKSEYLNIIEEVGFTNIKIQKEKRINLPDEILKGYLTDEAIEEFRSGKSGIFSATVYAEKSAACCALGCCN